MREMRVQPIIIFSVFNFNTSMLENNINHRLAKALLKNEGMIVSEVLGNYMGYEEKSLMIVNPSELDKLVILRLASQYLQQSILVRNQYNECHLEFLDGSRDLNLGFMRAVSAFEASQQNSWTYNPVNEQHYICSLS